MLTQLPVLGGSPAVPGVSHGVQQCLEVSTSCSSRLGLMASPQSVGDPEWREQASQEIMGSLVTGSLVSEGGSHVCLPDFGEDGVLNQERRNGKSRFWETMSLILEASVMWFGRT